MKNSKQAKFFAAVFSILTLTLAIAGCSKSTTVGAWENMTPHEQYLLVKNNSPRKCIPTKADAVALMDVIDQFIDSNQTALQDDPTIDPSKVEDFKEASVITFVNNICKEKIHSDNIEEAGEAMVLMDGPKTAVRQFHNTYARFPASNGPAGIATAGSISGAYVKSVSIRGGVIEATFRRRGVQKALSGESIYLHPKEENGKIGWTCKVSKKSMYKYVPSHCHQIN